MQDWKKKLKFIAITAAFAVLILIVLTNIFKMTRVSERDFTTYKQGLQYLNQKDYENAYFNFSNVSKNSAIYEIALLRQALCADELNDSETASKKYRMFIEKFPESIFVEKVYYSLAQNYFREKDYSKAEKTFNAIKKNFKDSEYDIASNYYLGLISKEKYKDKEKSKNFFIEYLKQAPDGRFALASIDEINSLEQDLTQIDYGIIGKAYLKNGKYKSALENLNKSYMQTSWGDIVIALNKLGEYTKACEIFEKEYNSFSNNIQDDEINQVIEAYAKSCPQGLTNGYKNVRTLSENGNKKGGDFALYQLAQSASEEEKLNLYSEIANNYPKGNYASNAVFNLFWNAYQNNRYAQAMKLGQLHIKEYPNTIASPKVIFWMGKISEKQMHKNEAKGFYQKLLELYPDDYYAYRAARKLSFSPNSGWKTRPSYKLPQGEQTILFPIKHTKVPDDSLTLINTIIKLNDYSLLREIEKDNKAIQSWILYNEGKYATSAALARDAIAESETKIPFSDSLYKLAYQLHYQEDINKNAKLYTLDPYLVTALIREESYFNKQAGSSVGAMGLMQLMPSTASFIAGQNGIPYSSRSSLYDPAVNIRLGCAYLSYAKHQLHNNDLLAVASYNGGPNAVKNWRDNMEYENFDEFIEHIPYPETRDYVKKVYRSYWVYLNVY